MLISFFYSCKKDESTMGDQSKDRSYFPLEIGRWIEYEADSIVHLDIDDNPLLGDSMLSYHFMIRESIDSLFIDGENQESYVIYRYKRLNDTLPWDFQSRWTAKVNSYGAQRVEDNVRYIKLQFPISSDAEWNGNAYNFLLEEDYSYESLYDQMQFNGLNFESTVSVLQYELVSNINRIYKKEIYAANTGMIFKELDNVNTTNTVNGLVILNGLEYKLTITGFGH